MIAVFKGFTTVTDDVDIVEHFVASQEGSAGTLFSTRKYGTVQVAHKHNIY